jgi:circadian clock protein KaiB
VPDVFLRLYIAGSGSSSRRAQQNLTRLRESLGSPCEVEIIDVLDQPQRAEKAGIIATPTLSYENGSRSRRVVGDLSESKRVLDFLGIETKEDGQ